ncbi:hypothetical protein M0813_24635 [Anaeramoeba flamelloides]|uniref:Uncharacterized protein n=1 Tax=Anaeramoeba flamelloides TaxID=1746091 RepID=A0ABQ8Y8A9_9EUKA|nr:hypothetical protein M0813_24635 [Anaeramoeba flamelloides]
MNISSNLQSQPNLNELCQQFKAYHTYTARLNAFLKIRPSSIIGLDLCHFQKIPLNLDQVPKTVRFRRDILLDLAYLAKRSLRTIARGLTTYLKTRFNLMRTGKYDSEWIVFTKVCKEEKFQKKTRRIKKEIKIKNTAFNKRKRQLSPEIRRKNSNNNQNNSNITSVNLSTKAKWSNHTTTKRSNKKEIRSLCSQNNHFSHKGVDPNHNNSFKNQNEKSKRRRTLKKNFSQNKKTNYPLNNNQSPQTFDLNLHFEQGENPNRNSKGINENDNDKNIEDKKKMDLKETKEQEICHPKQNTKINQNENNWVYGRIIIDLCPKHSTLQETWLSEIEKKYGVGL